MEIKKCRLMQFEGIHSERKVANNPWMMAAQNRLVWRTLEERPEIILAEFMNGKYSIGFAWVSWSLVMDFLENLS